MKTPLFFLVFVYLSLGVCQGLPNPPLVSPGGGLVHAPAAVTLENPNAVGAIYYTLDGSDPRDAFGKVASTARIYSQRIVVGRSMEVRSRVKSGSEWSDLISASFTADQDFSKLLFTEIMFHPQDNGDLAEFVELKNVGTKPLNLTGLQFAALDSAETAYHPFANGTVIKPGEFLTIAAEPITFSKEYPQARVDGSYVGDLSNSSAPRLVIRTSNGLEVASARYETIGPWQVVPDNHGYFPNDGIGFSLVRVNYDTDVDPEDYRAWRASTNRKGSPGADDPPPVVPTIYITELLARGSNGAPDAVELFNPNNFSVDISHWWLSDERNDPPRYAFPADTVIPPLGYLVVDETQFGPGPNGVSFSADGERCYIFSADANGILTGYSHGFAYPASESNVTFGRHLASDGSETFLPQLTPTFGSPNSGPRIDPVVISEVMYHPAFGRVEFVELTNTSDLPVNLWDPQSPQQPWFFNFARLPTGLTIPAHGFLLLVVGDPSVFRTQYNVPADVPIVSIATPLPDDTVYLSLLRNRPLPNEVDTLVILDHQPWPVEAAGGGSSLERLDLRAFGNEPKNWRASPTGFSPGRPNSGNQTPAVFAGADRTEFVGHPASLDCAISHDQWPNSIFSDSWEQVSGPMPATLTGPSARETTALFPVPGQYVLRLTANDGSFSASDTVTINVLPPSFDLWKIGVFPVAERSDETISGPLADPDRDGRLNVAEYLLASSPKIPNPGNLAPEIINGHLQIRWVQRVQSQIPDMTVIPERGDLLEGPWFSSPELFERTESNLGGFTEITLRDRLPISNRPQSFLRLRLRLR